MKMYWEDEGGRGRRREEEGRRGRKSEEEGGGGRRREEEGGGGRRREDEGGRGRMREDEGGRGRTREEGVSVKFFLFDLNVLPMTSTVAPSSSAIPHVSYRGNSTSWNSTYMW